MDYPANNTLCVVLIPAAVLGSANSTAAATATVETLVMAAAAATLDVDVACGDRQ